MLSGNRCGHRRSRVRHRIPARRRQYPARQRPLRRGSRRPAGIGLRRGGAQALLGDLRGPAREIRISPIISGSLQAFRTGLDDDPRFLRMSHFCSSIRSRTCSSRRRLQPSRTCARLGRPVVLSDGDVVFQPRKIKHAGIWDAVEGAVLIYVHKEKVLDHVQRRYPASHYVVVDDKPHLLAAMKTPAGIQSDDGIRAARALCAGPGVQFDAAPARSGDRAHRRSRNFQFIRLRGATMTMTQKLHRLGQSLWLDNITRDILDDGTLRRYIDELSVTGLTSNPTIFDEAIGGSSLTTTASSKRPRAGLSGEALFVDLALEDLRRAADLFRPDIRPHRRASTAGCRWRCRRCSPTTRTQPSRRRADSQARRPPQSVRQDPRHAGGRSRHRGGHLRGRAGQRHAAVLARAIPGRRRGLHARHRAAHRRQARSARELRGVALRQPLGQGRRGQGAGGAAQPARHRHRGAHLPGALRARQHRALARSRRRRRAQAAHAVGEHRHEGSEGLGNPLRRGAGGARHDRHHAGEDAAGIRRERQGAALPCERTAAMRSS